MTTSTVNAESVLAIDIGANHTRALLFDIAGERYRFIASGEAPTTLEAPYRDITIGVRRAMEQLQDITGRVFFNEEMNLILPAQADGSGVDLVVSTLSAGRYLNLFAAGLLEDMSLESARRLVESTYCRLAGSLSLADPRPLEAKIDAMLQVKPDVILLVGGTDGGASHALERQAEVVGLACYLLPPEKRPAVLYAGNREMAKKIENSLEGIVRVNTTANIRPGYDQKDLDPARKCLAEIVDRVRSGQLAGLQTWTKLSGSPVLSNAYAFGRMVRFLSKVNQTSKAALGIDLGASSTTIAAGYAGQLDLRTTDLGTGASISKLLERGSVEAITRWLPMHIPNGTVQDYLQHKALFPATLPVTQEDLAVEQAAARQIMRLSFSQFTPSFSSTAGLETGNGHVLCYEPIVATGGVLGQAPTLGQSLMMLLDGIQPIGISTLVLDQNHLFPALGAIAGFNSLLPVHVIESETCIYLGTVISPASPSRYNTPILNAHLVREDGSKVEVEVKQGSFHVLELKRGQNAELFLEPLENLDLGLGKTGRGVKISGGAFGAVIDARGRPLSLPGDDARRREMIKKWLWTLGG
jgi:uncharacterized protein (TIGR01319 family)